MIGKLWALTGRAWEWLSRHIWRSMTALVVLALILVLALDWQGSTNFTRGNYRLLIWLAILPGTVASGLFISAHRPSKWLDRTAINASGWLIIVFIFYLRTLVSVVTQHTLPWRGMPNALWSLSTIVLIDALIILRLVSFIKYRRAFSRRREELEREIEQTYRTTSD